MAYEEHHGPIPEGHHVHHDCGNRACINPEHLRVLAPRDHLQLKIQDCGHAERSLKKDGRTYCRACHREKQRERYAADPKRHRQYQRDYYWRKKSG